MRLDKEINAQKLFGILKTDKCRSKKYFKVFEEASSKERKRKRKMDFDLLEKHIIRPFDCLKPKTHKQPVR